MRSVQRRVEALLAEGVAAPHFKTARTCKKLLKRSDALWTFLYIEGVEPTNDIAEFIADACLALERILPDPLSGVHHSLFLGDGRLTRHAVVSDGCGSSPAGECIAGSIT